MNSQSSIRVYLDEDSGDTVLVRTLRSRGFDVVTVRESGMLGYPDDEQLEHAISRGRALVTFNVGDFYRLHTEYLRSGRQHTGIIFGKQQKLVFGDYARRLLHLLTTLTADEMVNRAEFLSDWEPA